MHPRFLHPIFPSVVLLCVASSAWAAATEPDFSDLSLEDLMNVELTTLGRRSLAVWDSPGASSVITGAEAIQAGAVDLPSALRLLPGVQVSRSDGINHAITMRGFNDDTTNKLLILRDGRSVYNSLYSGTIWPLIDVSLEDLNRVEIQRGPAGALWGTNAMNGVVNIVTKNAHATQGTLLTTAFGDHLDYAASARHGFRFSNDGAARIYASSRENDGLGLVDGPGSHGTRTRTVGSRLDWNRPDGADAMVIVEYTDLTLDNLSVEPSLTPPYSEQFRESSLYRTFNATARWSQPVGTFGTLATQVSWEAGTTRNLLLQEHHTTVDAETQLTLRTFANHELMMGLTYHITSDDIVSSKWLKYGEASDRTEVAGVYINDAITLLPNRLTFIVGTKLEHNSYTGWENQPTARLVWHTTPNQLWWASVSRAARTPSRSEEGVFYWLSTLPPGLVSPRPTALYALIEEELRSEKVTSYEIGHRVRFSPRLSVETSLFFSNFTHLRGMRPSTPTSDPATGVDLLVLNAENRLTANSYGGEISAKWNPDSKTRVDGSVSVQKAHAWGPPVDYIPDLYIVSIEGGNPRAEYKLHAGRDLPHGFSFDASLRHVTQLTAPKLAAYTGLDVRLAWKYSEQWTFDLVGRDVLDAHHGEFSSNVLSNTVREIDRSVFLRATLRF